MSYYQPRTMHDLLQHTLQEYGALPYTYEYEDGEFRPTTYSNFIADVERTAALLIEKGYKGERIMLYGKNSYQWLVLYFAITAYVGVAVCASKDWKAYDIANALAASRPALVLCDDELRQYLPGDQPVLPYTELQSLTQSTQAPSLVQLEQWEQPGSDIAIIIFTTGTTSIPKGVPLSLDILFANGSSLYRRVPSTTRDSYYLFLPMHHVYSQTCVTVAAFVVGAKLYISRDVHNFAEEAALIRPTIIFGVPLFFERVLNAISAEDMQRISRATTVLNALHAPTWLRRKIFKPVHAAFGGRVRLLTSGGALLNRSTKRFLRDVGIHLIEGYGMSESSGVVAAEYRTSRDRDAVGTVLESQQVIIHNPDEDGWGEVYVKGKCLMPGYDTPDGYDRRQFSDEGYYKSGDIGRLGKKRTLYIRGRKEKVLVLSSGENISINEMTSLLVEQEGIDKVYLRDESGYLAAEIFSKLTKEALAQKIASLNASLPRYKQIKTYTQINDYTLSEMK